MNVAPPPSPGSRIEELGDTLVVRFRPRRSWADIAFLSFWLTMWTFGGLFVMGALVHAGWGLRAFLAFWLIGWAFAESFAATQIAWQLVGRELLLVTLNELEVRKEIWRFAHSRRVHLLAVESIRAERVPSDEDEKPREDYRLAIVSQGQTLHVGDGMGEREAEYVATVVMSQVRPRPRWSNEGAEFGFPAPDPVEPKLAAADPDERPRAKTGVDWRWILPRIASPLVGGAIIVLVALVVVQPLRHPPEIPRVEPAPRPPTSRATGGPGPPLRSDYGDARAYATASTRYALTSGRTTIHATPTCGETVTWTSWTCRAPATSKLGPFAGKRLVYRCFVAPQTQPTGPPVRTIECGPENPPPIAP